MNRARRGDGTRTCTHEYTHCEAICENELYGPVGMTNRRMQRRETRFISPSTASLVQRCRCQVTLQCAIKRAIFWNSPFTVDCIRCVCLPCSARTHDSCHVFICHIVLVARWFKGHYLCQLFFCAALLVYCLSIAFDSTFLHSL